MNQRPKAKAKNCKTPRRKERKKLCDIIKLDNNFLDTKSRDNKNKNRQMEVHQT